MILLAELDSGRVRDRQRLCQDVRPAGELRRDLLMILEVQATIVAHAIVVAAIPAESDAEENVVRVVVVRAQKVRVVRRDDWQ